MTVFLSPRHFYNGYNDKPPLSGNRCSLRQQNKSYLKITNFGRNLTEFL
jgi:hypothetical protein